MRKDICVRLSINSGVLHKGYTMPVCADLWKPSVTCGGMRFRDLEAGTGNANNEHTRAAFLPISCSSFALASVWLSRNFKI